MSDKLMKLIETVEMVVEDYRKYNVHPAPNMVRLCDALADYKAEEAAPVDDVTSRHIQERLIAWYNTYDSGIDPEKLVALFESIAYLEESRLHKHARTNTLENSQSVDCTINAYRACRINPDTTIKDDFGEGE